jgi:lipocalin
MLFSFAADPLVPVVKNFDINKFVGEWHEIARYDHWFERGLTNVKTEYQLINDNKITIKNTGINSKNKIEEITGSGRFKDKKDEGWLEITFFWPFYSDYRIIYLDEKHELAIITSDTKKFLWILSRDKNTPKEKYIDIIKNLGFNTEKLIFN